MVDARNQIIHRFERSEKNGQDAYTAATHAAWLLSAIAAAYEKGWWLNARMQAVCVCVVGIWIIINENSTSVSYIFIHYFHFCTIFFSYMIWFGIV